MTEQGDFLMTLERTMANSNGDELLELATKHILAFVGANFAGIAVQSPSDAGQLSCFFPDSSPEQIRQRAIEDLAFGLNKPFIGARKIESLWLAKMVLDRLKPDSFANCLWKFRLCNVWSTVLGEREMKLKSRMDELATSINQQLVSNAPAGQHVEFLLERAHSQMYFFEYSAAKRAIDEAVRLAGIQKLDLGGALGKRTQFQQKSIAQLVLRLELEEATSAAADDHRQNNSLGPGDLPQNCKNQDDTLLDTVRFDDEKRENGGGEQQLNGHQTACLLAMAIWERHTNTLGRELGNETAMLFLEEVIRRASCWSIQTRALVERSRLEMANSRRVERASAQLESITRLLMMDDPKSEVDSARRLGLIFAAAPLPFWTVSRLHANVLISLGCISDALRLFEQLHAWEDVVKCYAGMGQAEKAESLIRKLLAEKEEPHYYAMLGDITSQPEYYQKAIQVSNDRSAPARASLGKLMLGQKNYQEALGHYKRSLEIQPLQLGVWFTMGYTAMKLGDYQTSVQAYHRCVSIEPEHFEAWNNLAASYIRLNQKHRAQKILQEALKLDWENARVWENLLLVSVDIGDFKQAIGALEKLMDMEAKRLIDELPLEIISTEILAANSADQPSVDLGELTRSLLGILARANARQSLSPKLLRLYAALKKPDPGDGNMSEWSTYILLLERAFQREFEQVTTSKAHLKYCELLKQLLTLADELTTFWRLQKLQDAQIKLQLQMRLRPIVGFFEKEFGKDLDGLEDEEVRHFLAMAKDLLV